MAHSRQDAFVQFNEWTQAENFLLVEKLTSRSEIEAWKDIAELCDDSPTFESASFRCKAVRKFAAFHGRDVESVTVEEVEKSPQGLRAWGEMNVVVPGMKESNPGTGSEVTGSGDNPPGAEGENKNKSTRNKGKKNKNKDGDESEPKAKRTKKEMSKEQQAEKTAKEILSHVQWSAQIMEKAAGAGDELPSKWRWVKPFLEEYNGLLGRFKAAMVSDEGGENISDFVDELKLSTINRSTRSLKKDYGDKYLQYLTIFGDRCQAIAAQSLVDFKSYIIKFECRLRSNPPEDERRWHEGSQHGAGYDWRAEGYEEIFKEGTSEGESRRSEGRRFMSA